jgi:hypothetical protein
MLSPLATPGAATTVQKQELQGRVVRRFCKVQKDETEADLQKNIKHGRGQKALELLLPLVNSPPTQVDHKMSFLRPHLNKRVCAIDYGTVLANSF